MHKQNNFKLILVIAMVAVISGILCFASIPVSAITISVGAPNPSTPAAGSIASFAVTLNVTTQDLLPVSTVQMDIYNVTNAAYRDTFTNLPVNTTAPAVTKLSTTDSSHTMTVLAAAGANWGTNQGSGLTSRWGYGTLDTGTTGNYSFGSGYGWGYSNSGNYTGNSNLTYSINWNVPATFPAGTYKAEIRVNAGSTTGTDYTFLQSGATFTVNPSALAPTISSFTPASGTSGTQVVITGTNFTGSTAVSFGGVAAQSYTVNSATQITATVGSGSTGYITVTNAYGTATSASSFTYASGATPTITSISSSTGYTGTTIYVYGTNLSTITTIYFGGTAATSTVVNSSTQVTAVVGAGTTGYVTGYSSTYATISSTVYFTYTSSTSNVVISDISPNSGGYGTTVNIYGSNLSSISTIYFGGTPATSTQVISQSQITAVVGYGTSGYVTAYSYTYGSISSSVYFYYTGSTSGATISSLSVNSGGYGTTVYIYGSNLSTISTIYFGGTAAQSTVVNSATQITAVVGYGASGYVTGYSYSYGTISSTLYFTYGGTTSGATISSLSVNSGGYGTTVYIYGSNLSGITTVYFGGTAAQSTVVNSSTQITAVVGYGASGYVTAYSSTYGTISSTLYFSYGGGSTSGATISSLSVNSGGYGTSVYIYGSNLSGITTVYFGGTAAQSTIVNSASQITAVVGYGASGYVTAYSSTYGTISSNLYFTYTGASTTVPTITSFTPTTGSSGNTVTISGTGLSNATAVSFGGVAAQSFSVNSDTQITAIVGIGASGTVNVTTAYGTGALAGFTFGSSAATTSLTGKVDASGKFTANVTASSNDNKALVTIPSGITGKLSGAALTQITIEQTDALSVPPPPAYSSYVSQTYNIGPNGATFDKQVSVAIIYDPLLIPSGVAESSLFASWWDATGNKWNSLLSTVDTVNKKITALADHFTYFAVIGSTQKAQFGVSDIQISPKQVQAGKEVTVTVILGNGGLVSGSYDVKLLINGKEAATKRVENMPGGATQKLTFTTTQNTPGTYTAEVEYLNGTFTVTPAPTTPATTTPAVTPTPTPTPTPTATTTTPAATVKPTATTPVVTTQPTTPTPTKTSGSGGLNWWLIGGVIIIVLIIAWIVYRVIMYQRRSVK